MRDERTYAIIGSAMEVHRNLGCGFLEAVYQEALELEFLDRAIPFDAQPTVRIAYKGKPLNKVYQPDFVCYKNIIVEIKANSGLTGIEEAQIINYLKASGINLGILINFGCRSLEYKRFVHTI